MPKINIPRERMLDILWESDDVIEDKLVDITRWSAVHNLIFKYGDKFYRTEYSRGATECQEEYPWDDEPMVECIEVKQVEKLVKVWEKVAD